MKLLVPVLMAVVLDLVGFGIVIPLLTFYAEEYGAGPVAVTLLMAVYSLAQFLMAPVWGALSDKYGRRPIMLFSIGMAAVCLAGFAWAESLVMLFVFRTLHGAAAANISTAQACVADVTTPENRRPDLVCGWPRRPQLRAGPRLAQGDPQARHCSTRTLDSPRRIPPRGQASCGRALHRADLRHDHRLRHHGEQLHAVR